MPPSNHHGPVASDPVRRVAAAAAVLLPLVVPAPATARQPPPLDRSPAALAAAVDPMLRQRADAFRRHDAEAFLATVDRRDPAFAERQRALVANSRNVAFATYTLRADVREIGDLSRPADRRRFGEDTVVLDVREEYALAGGYDEGGHAIEDLFLTLVRDREGRWRVAADDAVEDVGLLSGRHPWDFAPIGTAGSEHFLVLYPPNRAGDAPKVLAEAEAAYDRVAPAWPPAWNRRVAIELPRDVEDLGRRIQATFPLDNFVAFAASAADVEDLTLRFVGRRVMVNPANFLGNSTESRREILAHELIHVATRESAGPYLTAWIEEGYAQLLGEDGSAVGLSPVRTAVRQGAFAGRFPEDYEFLVGGSERIFRSYAESYLVAREIEKVAGRAGLVRFYIEAGDRGRLGPGVPRYRLDLASRRALGIPLTELERRWAADVRAGRLQ
jgi:hypothetical protein